MKAAPNSLCAVIDPQTVKNGCDMKLDCVCAEVKLTGDLFIRIADGHQLQDLNFAIS